ncbi:MAG: hypothetical protein Q4G07_04145 [Oscillospiraceae bacterium]|nr:hypothetical protein [Oscillospiraceae bacterium]
MTLLALLAALLCVCAYSGVLALRWRVPSGAAPLAVLCGGILWLCAAGYAGVLWLGGLLWYLGGLGALGHCAVQIKKTGVKQAFSALFTPGFVLFLGAALGLCLVLCLRAPQFTFWDEFSFWGTASKLTKLHDALYPAVESSMAGKLAYPPAIPLISYLFQFLAPSFQDWAAMAAYDVMLCACFGAVLSGLPVKKRRTGLFAGVLCLLLPFLFETATLAGGLSFVYRTLLSEIFLGCLFGAALAVWFSAKEKTGGTALRFALALTVLCLTKDVGLVLTAAAALIAGADLLFFHRKTFHFYRIKGWAAVFAALAVVILLAGTAYPGWNAYFGAATAIDRTAGDGAAGLTMQGVLFSGLKELLGIGRSAQFTQVFMNMARAWFTEKVSLLGSGFTTTLCILAVCALAFFTRPKGRRAPAAVYFCTGAVGLGGMMLYHLFAYVYVFDAAAGLALIDYGRYLGLYYLGWMLGAVCLLLPFNEGRRGRAALLGCTAGVAVLCALCAPLSRSLLAPGVAQSDQRQLINLRASEAAGVCGPGDKIFVVSQFDDARRWYQYAHELEPVRTLPMLGGTLIAPGGDMGDAPDQKEISPEGLRAWLEGQGCTYLLIDQAGEYDTQGYTALFTDGLRAYRQDGVRLYRAVEKDDALWFEPCGKAGVP